MTRTTQYHNTLKGVIMPVGHSDHSFHTQTGPLILQTQVRTTIADICGSWSHQRTHLPHDEKNGTDRPLRP